MYIESIIIHSIFLYEIIKHFKYVFIFKNIRIL